MDDIDQFPIYSVAVDPEYCPQCGTEVGTREFNAGRQHWAFFRNNHGTVITVVAD